MAVSKALLTGNTTMLILKLLEEKDRYGYQMIEELAQRSDHSFSLKAGTLYPLLHSLEKQGTITSYAEKADNAKVRKYYRITPQGKKMLADKTDEWTEYAAAVNRVLKGGADFATA